MKRMLWLLVGAGVLLVGVGPAKQGTALGEDQEVTRPSVFIWEICFWPLAGEPAWVELVNRGREPVDMRGFVLSLRSGHRYVFAEGIGSVPAGRFVLVKFDGQQGKLADDVNLEADKLAVLHTEPNLKTDPNVPTAVFPMEMGSCSLYSGAELSAQTIVDFVCWGGKDPNLLTNGGLLVNEHAAEAKVWGGGGYVETRMPVLPPGTRLSGAGPPPLERGGSIARKPSDWRRSSAWYLCAPDEISPGAGNRLAKPFLYDAVKNASAKSSKISLKWWGEYEWSYEIQIASSKDFASLVDKAKTEKHYYVRGEPLAPGKYYWRVRAIKGDEVSAWSKVGRFRVNPSG